MSLEDDLFGAFESHDSAAIQKVLAAGLSPTAPIHGQTPLMGLFEMYLRSPRFAECVRVLLHAGASFDDPLLEALALDDSGHLRAILQENPAALHRRFELHCAFTPLRGATPLHICAEYNALRCARVLLDAGHPVDAPAATDAHGFGGHTPLFHTVNSLKNFARPMLELLVAAGASLDLRLKGLIWGQGFAWETTILDLTPLSYTQCGLYSQFHRREDYLYDNLAYLYQKKYGQTFPLHNVPNKYLEGEKLFPPRM